MRAAVYSLAIVLALAMVLCMIPAAFAATSTRETVTDKSYDISIYSWDNGSLGSQLGSENNANSVTAKYNYEQEDKDVTGKFTEDKKMAIVKVDGFNSNNEDLKDVKITIDGKDLEANELAEYAKSYVGFDSGDNAVYFPVELTKAGYSDTYYVELTAKYSKGSDVEVSYTESAKITLKLENTAEYKNSKTATISKIESKDREMDAYIVGSKIYLDFVGNPQDIRDGLEITFKDNYGDLFDVVTWANDTKTKGGKGGIISNPNEEKLDNSKATYDVSAATWENSDYAKELVFKLETSSAIYETKKFDVVVRRDVVETDPKGIYFADSAKTIKIGEEYTPVVMGVATDKKVDADILPGKGTDKQVIDVTSDNTIIGTQEGVAYVYARYMTNDGKTYESSSMKITVTAKGSSSDDNKDDATSGKTYIVTASSLNVRSGAGTNFSQIGSLKNGATVKVESIANGWAKLENGGYVSAQYLAEVVDNGEAQTMYVTARTLNVRKGPGTSYAKVGTLSRGTAVQVVGFSGNWAKLSNGYYVSTSYLAK